MTTTDWIILISVSVAFGVALRLWNWRRPCWTYPGGHVWNTTLLGYGTDVKGREWRRLRCARCQHEEIVYAERRR